MTKFKFSSFLQSATALCLTLTCFFAIAVKPAYSMSFQDQVPTLIEEIRSIQLSGEEMESLRGDRDSLASCAQTMRRLQPQAEDLRAKIDSLEIDESRSDGFQASMAKRYLLSAATSLNLCSSCVSFASESCRQVNSSIDVALQILQGA